MVKHSWLLTGRLRYFKSRGGQLAEQNGTNNPFDEITFSTLAKGENIRHHFL